MICLTQRIGIKRRTKVQSLSKTQEISKSADAATKLFCSPSYEGEGLLEIGYVQIASYPFRR